MEEIKDMMGKTIKEGDTCITATKSDAFGGGSLFYAVVDKIGARAPGKKTFDYVRLNSVEGFGKRYVDFHSTDNYILLYKK